MKKDDLLPQQVGKCQMQPYAGVLYLPWHVVVAC